MKYNKHTKITKFTALILVLVLAAPIYANAAVIEPADPNASYYLTSYSGYIAPLGGGVVGICFSVTGTTTMDEIGALRVTLEESTNGTDWKTVAGYHYTSYSSMIGYSKVRHSGSVTYDGVAGRYYRAYITIWAGKDGSGDTRYFWTNSKLAT